MKVVSNESIMAPDVGANVLFKMKVTSSGSAQLQVRDPADSGDDWLNVDDGLFNKTCVKNLNLPPSVEFRFTLTGDAVAHVVW